MRQGSAILSILLLISLLAGWVWLDQPDRNRTSEHAFTFEQVSNAHIAGATRDDDEQSTSSLADHIIPEPAADLPGQIDSAAILSLRATLSGDTRAPVIGEDMRRYQRADSRTLASPSAYAARQEEHVQQQRATFVYAATLKLAEIDAQLDWGRENGVSADQLAMAQEKRDRLASAQLKLLENDPTLNQIDQEPTPILQK